MEVLQGTWQDTASSVVDRLLPPVCSRPESLLELPSLFLSDIECFKATLSMLIGFAIVAFAGLVKLPQISRILSRKSVQGLSEATFLFETFGYTYNLAAHYRQDYPVSTYGDFVVLIVENYYIMYLVYSYTERKQMGVAIIAAFFGALVFLCSPLFPIDIIKLLLLANVPVVVFSRVPQVYANYVNSSTGALSVLTCWGIFLGASARIFTTMQDVKSFNILVGYLASAILNGIIAFQVLYYNYFARQEDEGMTKKAE